VAQWTVESVISNWGVDERCAQRWKRNLGYSLSDPENCVTHRERPDHLEKYMKTKFPRPDFCASSIFIFVAELYQFYTTVLAFLGIHHSTKQLARDITAHLSFIVPHHRICPSKPPAQRALLHLPESSKAPASYQHLSLFSKDPRLYVFTCSRCISVRRPSCLRPPLLVHQSEQHPHKKPLPPQPVSTLPYTTAPTKTT